MLLIAASGAHLPFELFLSLSLTGRQTRTGLFGMAAAALLCPLVLFFPSETVLEAVSWRGALLLAFAALINILSDRKPAVLVFFLSGLLGFSVLPLPSGDGLFAMLGGLFALPSLVWADNSISVQKPVGPAKFLSGLAGGVLAGMAVGLLPAMSSSLATALLWTSGSEVLSGATLVFSLAFSLATLAATGKARNGALVGINLPLQMMVGVVMVSLSVSIALARAASLWDMSVISSKLFRAVAFLFVLACVFCVCGSFGLLVTLTSFSLGMMPYTLGTRKSQLMGALVLPTLAHFGTYLW